MSIVIHAGSKNELDITNGNFSTLWSALGLEFDYCGEISSKKLRDALQKTPLALVCRSEVIDGNIIDAALYPEQVARYFKVLFKVCDEADQLKSQVYWG